MRHLQKIYWETIFSLCASNSMCHLQKIYWKRINSMCHFPFWLIYWETPRLNCMSIWQPQSLRPHNDLVAWVFIKFPRIWGDLVFFFLCDYGINKNYGWYVVATDYWWTNGRWFYFFGLTIKTLSERNTSYFYNINFKHKSKSKLENKYIN